jgi:nitroreductase
MMQELVKKSRSCRRFKERVAIEPGALEGLVDLARLSPSAGNRQPLKYVLSWEPGKNGLIFPALGWAAYLKDWPGPVEGERPAAYILILGDSDVSETVLWDHSIAAQTIALGAAEAGLGACIIASIDKELLRKSLQIPGRYQILLVVALGHPAETIVLDTMKEADFRYWRDASGVHHVPKRTLDEIILPI